VHQQLIAAIVAAAVAVVMDTDIIAAKANRSA
jgi:hypothetical protein